MASPYESRHDSSKKPCTVPAFIKSRKEQPGDVVRQRRSPQGLLARRDQPTRFALPILELDHPRGLGQCYDQRQGDFLMLSETAIEILMDSFGLSRRECERLESTKSLEELYIETKACIGDNMEFETLTREVEIELGRPLSESEYNLRTVGELDELLRNEGS